MKPIRCPINEDHRFLKPDPEFGQLRCPKCGFSILRVDLVRLIGTQDITSFVRQQAEVFRERHPSIPAK